jgi:hypothetical protein
VSTRTGMQHLTLDTGHTRASFRDELEPAVLERLRPMTVTGTHRMPLGCSAKVTVDGPAALAGRSQTAGDAVAGRQAGARSAAAP